MVLLQALKIKAKSWFVSRMPRATQIKLNQRSSYILPTRAGYLVIAVVLLMLLGATNYQNNLAFLLTFLLVGIGLVCMVFTFKNLQGVQFSLLPPAEVFADQTLPVGILLKSLDANSHYSLGVGESSQSMCFCNLTANQESHLKLELKAGTRGYWQLPSLQVTSEFPFGWFKSWAYFQFTQSIIIYPKPLQPPQADFLYKTGDQSEQGSKLNGNEDLYGLKPYQPGDPLSRVDWKAFARGRGMFTREFVSYQSQQLCFDWQDYPGCDKETRLSYLTFLVLEAASQNMAYSLVLPDQQLLINDGEMHRRKCLTALALYSLEPQAGAITVNWASQFSGGD